MSNLNNAIKSIISNYIQNMTLANLVYGTYTGNGLKLDDKPIAIGLGMVTISETLKESSMLLKSGDRVAVFQAQGGQNYYILDRL